MDSNLTNQRYTLMIDVEEKVYQALKKGGYVLCISKKVNGTYNVVWDSRDFYPFNNVFEWTEQYAVFGSAKYESDRIVKNSTSIRDIQFGQTSVIDTYCDMDRSMGEPDPSSDHFTVCNRCAGSKMYIGAAQSINGSKKKMPISLLEGGNTGETLLSPTNSVLVFFSETFKAGMLFTEPTIPVSTEVVFTLETASQHRLFTNDQKWVAVEK